jgi:outer membrane protein
LRRLGAALGVALVALGGFGCARSADAETIGGALTKAYLSNPDIGQQRAAVRVTDEDVSKAAAGYRPTISAEAESRFLQDQEKDLPQEKSAKDATAASQAAVAASGGAAPIGIPKARGFGVTANEELWNANRTANSIRRAESRVMAAREQLRNTEQNVLLEGVAAYMNVLRDTAILALDRSHVHVLEEQLRETKDRYTSGEVTQTDIAQAEAALAGGQANAFSAQSTLQTSLAEYRRVIGEEPKRLDPAPAPSKLLPKTLLEAVAISQIEHPAIVASEFGVDAAALEVTVAESRLYPTVALTGLVDRRFNVAEELTPTVAFTASLTTTIRVPIYDGGKTFASTRQAKELLDQRELQTDLQRDKVRAAVVSAWGRKENAPGIIEKAKAEVAAAELALTGMRREAALGQRTTQDELIAEQTVLKARTQLITAERDAVVASYALLSAVGRLSTTKLGLAVMPYDPAVHFDQVKDKWFGLRTPDGR